MRPGGGIAAVLNEWAQAAGAEIFIDEGKIPVKNAVKGFCELLGFEPYQLACEGRAVFAVRPGFEKKALKTLKSHPLGKNAEIIGFVQKRGGAGYGKSPGGRVILKGIFGVNRVMEAPSGELLPRIC